MMNTNRILQVAALVFALTFGHTATAESQGVTGDPGNQGPVVAERVAA